MGSLFGNHMETFMCCFGGSGINVRKYDTEDLLAGWCWSGGFIFLWIHSKVFGVFFQCWSVLRTKHLQDK